MSDHTYVYRSITQGHLVTWTRHSDGTWRADDGRDATATDSDIHQARAMTDHRVTWDHTGCDHDDGYCMPEGTLTCEAVDQGEKMCRWSCDDPDMFCETWSLCDDPRNHIERAEGEDPWHVDPGVPHCAAYGHRMIIGECNVIGYHQEDTLNEMFGEYRDGPVDVEFSGDGYELRYDPSAA